MAKAVVFLAFGLLQVFQLHAFDSRRFAPGERQPQLPGQNEQRDRGTWGVSVNKDKGRGPQIRTEGQGNIWTSKDGNWQVDGHGHHEAGRGRKPEYGGGVEVKGRWRREAEDDQQNFMDESQIDSAVSAPREKRSPQHERGSIGVTVNKDQGRGPQVRTDARGNIYTSPNGQFHVDGHGHHEFGRGRKPDYGGGVQAGGNIYTSPNRNWRVDGQGNYDVNRGMKPNYGVGVIVKGRFRRDTEDIFSDNEMEAAVMEEAESQLREKRSPQRERGSIGVSVNKDQGRGPQVRTDARGNIYTSPNGQFHVNGHGHHEFGRGRKPDYGAGVQAGGNIYTSPNKNWRVDGHGNYDVNRGMKPNYGVGVSVNGRFRRDTEDIVGSDEVEALIMEEEESQIRGKRSTQQVSQSGDRGSWGVSVNKDKGHGPQVRTEGQGNVYSSPNGNVKVDAHGHHEFGKGRKPSYGGGVSVKGRWRRDTAELEDDALEGDVEGYEERMKRSADPNDKNSVNVQVSHDKGRGPHIRTEAERNFYRSPNGNWQVNGYGYHEAGRGMKPDYGGGVRVTGRW